MVNFFFLPFQSLFLPFQSLRTPHLTGRWSRGSDKLWTSVRVRLGPEGSFLPWTRSVGPLDGIGWTRPGTDVPDGSVRILRVTHLGGTWSRVSDTLWVSVRVRLVPEGSFLDWTRYGYCGRLTVWVGGHGDRTYSGHPYESVWSVKECHD